MHGYVLGTERHLRLANQRATIGRGQPAHRPFGTAATPDERHGGHRLQSYRTTERTRAALLSADTAHRTNEQRRLRKGSVRGLAAVFGRKLARKSGLGGVSLLETPAIRMPICYGTEGFTELYHVEKPTPFFSSLANVAGGHRGKGAVCRL